jgi:hypothetical protein
VLGRDEDHARLEVVATADFSYPQARLSSSTRVPDVSRNHLYRYLCPCQGELRRELIACLRYGRSTRLQRSRGTDRRGQIFAAMFNAVNVPLHQSLTDNRGNEMTH